MLKLMRSFLGMIRFSHTVFALPFALLSALLAWQGHAQHWPLQLIGIVLCMVFARSAAMGYNRIVDRKLDAQNPRTAGRHLPSGQLSVQSAWMFTFLCSLGFAGGTAIFWTLGNPWPLYFCGPILLFICVYSHTKRFTFLCHVWLGASLLLAPLSAWIAIRGLHDLAIPLTLGGAVLFWVTGFDILYACQDTEFDRRAKLSSVPARFGIDSSLTLAMLSHLVMLAFLVALFFAAYPLLGYVYSGGVLAVAILIAIEHWLVRPDDLTRVNDAFFKVNGIISMGLFIITAVQLSVNRWG